MEIQSLLEWTLLGECKVPEDVNNLLTDSEEAIAAYKTFRDTAIFTNKRIIMRDAQGMTGKKAEVYSIPYDSIIIWSTENGGFLDINSEVCLWTRLGNFKIKLSKGVDVREFDKLIANYVLR